MDNLKLKLRTELESNLTAGPSWPLPHCTHRPQLAVSSSSDTTNVDISSLLDENNADFAVSFVSGWDIQGVRERALCR